MQRVGSIGRWLYGAESSPKLCGFRRHAHPNRNQGRRIATQMRLSSQHCGKPRIPYLKRKDLRSVTVVRKASGDGPVGQLLEKRKSNQRDQRKPFSISDNLNGNNNFFGERPS